MYKFITNFFIRYPEQGYGTPGVIRFSGQVLQRGVIFLIHIYQMFSACFPPKCRFYPSCSNYMLQAITRHGLLKGSLMGTVRICKCHPFNPGGYDPVK